MASVASRLQTQLLQIRYFKQPLRRCLSSSSEFRVRRSSRLMNRFSSDQNRTDVLCMCGKKHITAAACISRHSSTSTDQHLDTDPYTVIQPDLTTLCDDINQKFTAHQEELRDIAQYYFDGQGKSFRPMVVMLMSKAINIHTSSSENIELSQKHIAMISEMIHTASLIHDDVIDSSSTRRGKPTVDKVWGQRRAILAGNYILSESSMLLARIGNVEVVQVLSQVLMDLVRGELMQLGSKEDPIERFNHYLKKTFKKTASLVAHSCKAVAILGGANEEVVEIAYQYGRNVGIAFQLTDDLLDFTSCDSIMGKPTAADLKLGLATAPVLFASQEFDELNPMIMRRFSHEGDVERARELVAKSDGISQTRFLAESHSREAIRLIKDLNHSIPRDALEQVAHTVLKRSK